MTRSYPPSFVRAFFFVPQERGLSMLPASLKISVIIRVSDASTLLARRHTSFLHP